MERSIEVSDGLENVSIATILINLNVDIWNLPVTRILENVFQKFQRLSTIILFHSFSDITEAVNVPADLPQFDLREQELPSPGDFLLVGDQEDETWVFGILVSLYKTGRYCSVNREGKVFEVLKTIAGEESKRVTILGHHVAYSQVPPWRHLIGRRVLVKYSKELQSNYWRKNEKFYLGTVVELPTTGNRYRYLIMFDDGYPYYVSHADTRVIVDEPEVKFNESTEWFRRFLNNYVDNYPNCEMITYDLFEHVIVLLNNTWVLGLVINIDASIIKVEYENKSIGWYFCGAEHVQKLDKFLLAPSNRPQHAISEGWNSEPSTSETNTTDFIIPRTEHDNAANIINVTRATSTRTSGISRPGIRVRPLSQLMDPALFAKQQMPMRAPALTVSPHQTEMLPECSQIRTVSMVLESTERVFTPHRCSVACRGSRRISHLNGINPLLKPMAIGWKRVFERKQNTPNGVTSRIVIYVTPCQLRLKNMKEVFCYLARVYSTLGIECFTFDKNVNVWQEFFVLHCNVLLKDISKGKENVPVPCVNYVDKDLPKSFIYSTKRIPTKAVPLSLNSKCMQKCDCRDNCQDRSKCSCWQLTLSGAEKIGMRSNEVGYQYRRLLEPVQTGIYECHDNCACKKTCLNRVVQNPLQQKLQVFKTISRGWGVRAVNDIPRGSFLCSYVGKLFTGAAANKNGLKLGDEYLSALNYIECAEVSKRGYEKQVHGDDSEDDKENASIDDDDEDFRPGDKLRVLHKYRKGIQKRKRRKKLATSLTGRKCSSGQTNTRTLFGKKESTYVMDSRMTGNVARFLNHSCAPNAFVQNVFMDSHDIRFPSIAFFALTHIKAGDELTWDYGYEVGAVENRVINCECRAPNCRKRFP